MAATPKIVLTYFPIHARLTAARMALIHGNVPYEVVSIGIPEWLGGANQQLDKYPLGDLPVMTVNGKTLSGSLPMWQYTGAISGLWPTDPLEAAQATEYFTTCEEVFTGYDGVNFIQTVFMQNEEEKKKAREGPLSARIKFYFRRVEELAQANGANGKLVGASTTVADFHLWWVYTSLARGHWDYVAPEIVAGLPGVKAVADAVAALGAANPKLQAYMDEAVPPAKVA